MECNQTPQTLVLPELVLIHLELPLKAETQIFSYVFLITKLHCELILNRELQSQTHWHW